MCGVISSTLFRPSCAMTRSISVWKISSAVSACLARRSTAIQRRTPRHHEIGAHRHGLDEIGTASRAAIDDDLQSVADRTAHLGHELRWRRRGIQIATAVIRQHHTVETVVCCNDGVLPALQPLDEQIAWPHVTNALDVVPTLRVGLGQLVVAYFVGQLV